MQRRSKARLFRIGSLADVTRHLRYANIMTKDAKDLETVAVAVATEAARLVLEGFSKRFAVSTKGPNAELFTEYDVRSEELVRERLQQRTPGIAIVGEEHGGEPGDDLTWYIDPIDGTINFVAGHPVFAVSVGIKRKDQPIAGAVVAPALRLTWSGTADGPSTRNGEQIRVSEVSDLRDALVATGFPSRSGASQAEKDLRLQQYARLLASARDIRRCGSAAIDLCMVADGTYEAYWQRQLSPWDTAAGAAIVLGAGGRWRLLAEGQPEAQEFGTNGPIEAPLLHLLGA